MSDLAQEAETLFEYAKAIRRDIHKNPELGFEEKRTADIVSRELRRLGYKVSTGIGKTGVVTELNGKQAGKLVLLRFDMDALPIQEETGADYASKVPGVMHACGHDGHVAIGLTAAHLLMKHKDEISGTVKLIFQPAEEGLGGAESMIADGIIDNPFPDYCLALHLWNDRPVGWVAVVHGPFMAGSDMFKIKIIGRGGHGAMPELVIDPILAGTQIVNALQSIVSRNLSPLQSAVISVTQFHGGNAFNVIPSLVELGGTIRSFDYSVRKRLIDRFQRIIQEMSDAFECQAEFEVTQLTPAVINDPFVTEQVCQALAETLPSMKVEQNYQTMVSEDMAFLMEKVPGCYFMIGSANPELGLDYSHHSSKFDFDELVLPKGAALISAAALKLLKQNI